MTEETPWRNKEVIRELCKERELSDVEIAEELGCSQPTVTRWRNRLDIEQPENSPWRDEGLLNELYKEQGLSDAEIAEELGCTPDCITKWRDKFGIESDYYVDSALDDEEKLKQLYEDEELSTYDIADRFGCCEYSVRKRLIEFGIERRSQSDYANRLLADHDELRRLYVEEGLSTLEIAKRAEETPSTVQYWMDKHDIATRGPTERQRVLSKDDLEKIESLYWDDEHSTRDIADLFDVHSSTVCRWMEDADINRRDVQEALRISNGTGGRSPLGRQYYGPNWANIREEIIDDAEKSCEVCGKTREEHYGEYGFDLHVHHVKKLRNCDSFEEANDPDNLICLCVSCHKKWEGVPLAPVTPCRAEVEQ
jgi:DNA-directed RNA polymerase specialized sigma24 family protein